MRIILRPRIGRFQYTTPISRTSEPTWQWRFNSMFANFEREYVTHHPTILNRKIDKITLAQHYGLATQLLDWTLNPLIALFFACEKHSKEDGIVFIFMPSLLPDILTDADLNNVVNWQPLRPIRLDQRMINQDTAFTFHKDPTKDFGEELDEKCNGVVIPAVEKPFILRQLASIGIHRAFVFPGLSTICERIDSAYKNNFDFNERFATSPLEKDFVNKREPYLPVILEKESEKVE